MSEISSVPAPERAFADPIARDVPGFRRRILVEPAPNAVSAIVEDDYHRMGVILRHDGQTVNRIETVNERAPWDICPGAAKTLVATFEGLPLDQVSARRDKKLNCTHLHDMAVLAAAHAHDAAGFEYAITATDPVEGERILEIRKDGQLLHRWTERDRRLVAPAELEGMTLHTMRDWIAQLDGPAQEAARALQWGSIIALGRLYPVREQNLATADGARCYAFQPERTGVAERVGEIVDFTAAARAPLDGFDAKMHSLLHS